MRVAWQHDTCTTLVPRGPALPRDYTSGSIMWLPSSRFSCALCLYGHCGICSSQGHCPQGMALPWCYTRIVWVSCPVDFRGREISLARLVWHGSVRLGSAWSGSARFCSAQYSTVQCGLYGIAWCGTPRSWVVCPAWHSMAWCRLVRLSLVRFGPARDVRLGAVWCGSAWHSMVWLGLPVSTHIGSA